jgi:hypothetical protein
MAGAACEVGVDVDAVGLSTWEPRASIVPDASSLKMAERSLHRGRMSPVGDVQSVGHLARQTNSKTNTEHQKRERFTVSAEGTRADEEDGQGNERGHMRQP